MTDDETTTEPIQEALDAFLVELLGYMPEVTHRWAGIFGLTQDLLPLVGRVPDHEGIWIAAGYSGHGNVLGFMCGEFVASALLGKVTTCSSSFRRRGCSCRLSFRRFPAFVVSLSSVAGHDKGGPDAYVLNPMSSTMRAAVVGAVLSLAAAVLPAAALAHPATPPLVRV